MKIIYGLVQGSQPWHEHRRLKWNASESPAMLDESPHMSRAEFLRRRATGIEPEVDGATQHRFDRGHTVEGLLVQVAAKHLGEPLHPFVAVADFDERYSASFDGCTFVGDVTAECKLLNARLRAAFADMETIAPEHREASAGRCLPIDYRIQLEQQLRVAEADRAFFITGELRDDETLGDVLSCWYYPDDALWARIQAGWPQFEEDLAAYVPPAPSALEKIVAEPVEALPAPVIQVSGQLTLQDNFKVFEQRLRAFLENTLIREPKTDEDFVNLDAQIKSMKQAREALGAAEAQMLAQVQPVDQAKKTKDMLDKMLQQNVSMAEKLLTAEKERRRGEIVAGGVAALREHVAKLNDRLGAQYMPQIQADFGGVIKGLKSLASMEDKVAAELARAKIAANEMADRIQANREDLKPGPGGIPGDDWIVLFPDFAQVCTKAPEDFRNLRIARVETERLRREAEREKIRAEEAAKLAAAAAPAPTPAPAPIASPAVIQPAPAANSPLPSGNVSPLRSFATAGAPASPPTMTLGAINERIGLAKWSEADLTALGFPPASTRQNTKLYHEADFGRMLDSAIAHLRMAAAKQLQAA